MAEYQLNLFKHWSSCSQCQAKEDCEVLTSIPIPEFNIEESDLDFDAGSIAKEE
jgi:hypothetical protein